MNIAERLGRREAATGLVMRCLGRFRLEDQSGNQLQLRTKKARAVLAALALTGRPMSREALMDLLWSDRGPAQARSSLRQTIFELQHFRSDDAPLLSVGRDELAVWGGSVVTDVEQIRKALAEGDWPRLLALLGEAETGLFTDLDGLDPEFDDWLRIQRAHEPERSLSAAASALERCRAEAGPKAALELASEILRLDPMNEEATRLALDIDHQLGDRGALHRHFHGLRDRLADEYGAAPSPETVELFERLSEAPPLRRQDSADAAIPIKTRPSGPWWRNALVPLIILAVAAALLAALVWSNRARAPTADRPILIAVLPFEQQPRHDTYLAEGVWDETRRALSRSPRLRVLGRATTRAVAERNLTPSQYRERLGVDYLLEGSVRRVSERVLVSVALTRTSDGVAIWEDSFRARLGDPFALQEAIAGAIEGKLRGRLARGGGRRPDQIATMPEVYALYGEARALFRSRDLDDARRAESLLRRAIQMDPNYAPAWASLAYAMQFTSGGPVDAAAANPQSLAAVRRALTLAPNLAEGHGTLAALESGNSQAAELSMRRAVTLDPSYAEGWNWLGNALHANYRYAEAVAAFERAIEIDPLWFPPVQNLVWSAHEGRDQPALDRLFRTLRKAGASAELVGTVRAEDQLNRGDFSASLQTLMAVEGNARSPRRAAFQGTADVLMMLDYPEAAAKVSGFPGWYGQLVRSERLPPSTLDGRPIGPADFFGSIYFSPFACRAMVNLGQASQLVRIYRSAFHSPDDFISRARRNDALNYLAPTIGVALKSTGSEDEARYILAAAAKYPEGGLKTAPASRQPPADLALMRAAQGEREQALRLLTQAVSRGWMPDGRRQSVDLAREPAYRELLGEPRFRAIRQRILNHVSKERAELGPLEI